jgi:hypothetical protein
MRILCLTGLLALCSVPAAAQRKSLLFVGRFPFTSLDAVNERANGSITQLEEFDISLVTPDATNPFVARTFWLTATTHDTQAGDAYNDGNYTRLYNFKTYFERWNFAAPFVKVAHQAACRPEHVFWTVRDNNVNKNFTVKTNNGTGTAIIQPGDFFRLAPNGNVEYFITQAQIMTAAGPQPGAARPGASAICQDSAGNLYYSPAEGGSFVTGYDLMGVWGTPVFHNDASIMMIRAADITYDAAGNVSAVNASSAFCIFSETTPGPSGQPTVRVMQVNAGAQTNAFAPITTTNNMVGLALDPNGGTITASLPWGPALTFEVVPNFVWTDDGGTFAATMFSTRVNPANNNPGSVAVINGVLMGATGGPATGAYWGVQQDVANFKPTTMGFAVIDEPSSAPFIADAPNNGAILAADTMINLDFYAGPNAFTFAVLATGPLAPGQVPFGFDVGFLFGADSYRTLFGVTSQIGTFNLGLSNAAGYATFSIPKPTQPGLTGLPLIGHGLKFTGMGPGIALSNPVISQFK